MIAWVPTGIRLSTIRVRERHHADHDEQGGAERVGDPDPVDPADQLAEHRGEEAAGGHVAQRRQAGDVGLHRGDVGQRPRPRR